MSSSFYRPSMYCVKYYTDMLDFASIHMVLQAALPLAGMMKNAAYLHLLDLFDHASAYFTMDALVLLVQWRTTGQIGTDSKAPHHQEHQVSQCCRCIVTSCNARQWLSQEDIKQTAYRLASHLLDLETCSAPNFWGKMDSR